MKTTDLKQEFIERFGMRFLRSTKYNEIWKGDDTVMIWSRLDGSIKIKQVYNEYNNEI